MDQAYLQQILNSLIAERAIHDRRFSTNPAHKDCLPRFDRVIELLERQLVRCKPRLDFSISETALPDAIEEAGVLARQARIAEDQENPDLSEVLRHQARELFFKEMNELDGFER